LDLEGIGGDDSLTQANAKMWSQNLGGSVCESKLARGEKSERTGVRAEKREGRVRERGQSYRKWESTGQKKLLWGKPDKQALRSRTDTGTVKKEAKHNKREWLTI